MIRKFCLRQMSPVLLAAAMFGCAPEAAADAGTRSRDYDAKKDPVVARLRAELGITPLPEGSGKASLRIWDYRASLTFSVSGDEVAVTIIYGYGEAWSSIVGAWDGFGTPEPEPGAEERLETRTTKFIYRNPGLARDTEYLISNIRRFDREGIGADGSTTFVDAVDAEGRSSTFENWS